MSIRDYKITDAQFSEKGVIAAPDTLTGTAAENKGVFDRFAREIIAPQFNAIVDEFADMEESANSWSAKEAQRVQQENARQSAEQGRVSAEGQRVQSEKTRLSAESRRVADENARSAAETARTLSAISRPMPSPGIRTAFIKILSPFPVFLTIYIIVTGLGAVVNAHFYTFRGNLPTSLII